MQDELHRPLGLNRRRGFGALRLAALAGFIGALMLVLGTGAHFFVGPQAPQLAAADPPAPAMSPGPALADRPSPETTAAVSRQAPATLHGDDDGAALVELDADGSIEPSRPLPEIRRQELALAHLPDPALIERGATGVIPRRSADGLRPMDVYSRPPATEGNFGVARVVIIVGGMGISQTGSQAAVRNLPGSITLAFAPYGNSLARWMQEARKHGHELLLQLPMEPFDYPANNPGPHTLSSRVSAEENLADLHWAMSRITNYVGVMNFLGGRLVTTPSALKPIFEELAGRGLLFVDDGSVKNSMTRDVATAALLPYAQADIVIDADRSRQAIAARLDDLAKQARRTGLAIGVASAFPESIEMIARFVEQADKLGIEITPVSAIVADPERGRG
ncbi:MAG: hypothetical protein BroJett030_03930 [Alphaproteobacteria bacterium]|nr:MAG: hypothetical protein BroJett030_03930 [Alphaproteobacteria bacterium]